MYALSIRQPYAALIVHGPKRIENRTRRILYRGPVLIHAASFVPSRENMELYKKIAQQCGLPALSSCEYGGIIGVANVIDCHDPDGFDTVPDTQRAWWHPGSFGWALDNVQPTPHLACKGRLGLWRLDPPKDWLLQLSPEAAALCR